MNLSTLLGEAASQAVAVDRQAERSVERDAATGVEFELLAPDWRAEGLGIILVRLPRGQGTGTLSPHPLTTREHIYVLSGRLTAFIDGREFTLGPGDALSFTATESHEVRAAGEDGCTFLVTTKGPRPEFLRYRA